ncbi:MAG TPA: chromate transporter [Pyrinomonadaceae bacterium]|nr:chromate transporter [Pyrinomonadaceae bacterium]
MRYERRRLKRVSRTASLGGLFLSFLKIGLTGFGGGLAVIAQIRTLTVFRRDWLTDREFAEGFALAQSLPGTNAGNTVTYIGLRLRGVKGAGVAMAGFILPSMLMMIALAILYRHLRYLPDTDRIFHGLNAAVVALVLVTAWRMGRNTLTKPWQWYIAVLSCLIVSIFHATLIEVILAAGLAGIYIDSFAEPRWQRWRRIARVAARRRARRVALKRKNFVGGYITRAVAEERLSRIKARRRKAKASARARQMVGSVDNEAMQAQDFSGALTETESPNAIETDAFSSDDEERLLDKVASNDKSKKGFSFIPFIAAGMPIVAKLSLLVTLSVIFLRIGAITFGGGFVMIPLIEAEVVDSHHWLTHQEFVDATALGQITPGPVLITATFIGYRVAGTLGAIVATLSVFLPAFVLTIAAGSSLRKFRMNRQVQAFLRGVTPAVVGLLVAAAITIGRAGIHSWIGVALALAAVLVLIRFRVNAVWVIFGAGLLRFLLGYFLQ